jgi:hypothetical protein
MGIRRGAPKSQGDAVEVGPDQATAGRGAQKLEEKQERSPRRWEQGIDAERG